MSDLLTVVATMVSQARRGDLTIDEIDSLKDMGFRFTKNNDPRNKNEFDVTMEVK